MSTILLNVKDIRGAVFGCEVRFTPTSTAYVNGASLILSFSRTIDLLGTGSVDLQAGSYTVVFIKNGSQTTDSITINVPNDSDTYTFNSLITSGATTFSPIVLGVYSPSGNYRIGIDDDGNIFPIHIS